MNLRNILIASDIDGTLVPEGSVIPERNLAALRRFAEKGGRFTLATGRSIGSAGRFLGDLPVNAPAILLNGCLLYDYAGGEVLLRCGLEKENAAPLVHTLYQRFPELGMECFYDDCVGILRRNGFIGNTKTPEIYSFTEGVETSCFQPWLKILLGGEAEAIREAMRFAVAQPHPGLRLVFSSENFLEILPEQANKGTMLRSLAQRLSIPMENVYAVGDYFNDEELLEAAGHAVVPANAPEELQRKAELVVCDCRGGALADLVEFLESKYPD